MSADVHCGNCMVYHGSINRREIMCPICEKNDMWEPLEEEREGGLKYDDGKLDLSLIPPEALELLGQVYAAGSKVYGRDNWTKGFDENRLLAAGLRHYVAYRKGDRYDSESGAFHLAAAAWNFLTVEISNLRNETKGSK